MQLRTMLRLALLVAASFSLTTANSRAASAVDDVSRKNQAAASFASRAISFEANIGQADGAVEFLARGQNGDLLLTRSEAWLALARDREGTGRRVLRMKLAGANANPKLEGLDCLPGTANYLWGNDPSRWRTNATTFARVKYHEVYPGVDLIYYGNQQKLEYDFVVQPGADPAGILLEFAGADSVSLDGGGDLRLQMAGDSIRQHKPVVYQEIGGARKMLSGNYVLHSGMQAAFQVADYDKTKPLIIDPALSYAGTFGGSSLNQALAIALDAVDDTYITGTTTSSDFPILNPLQNAFMGTQDAFVVKLDTNGNAIFSTYLGGGLVNDVTITTTSGRGIAVDVNSNVFVTGYTTSTNFPTLNPLQATNASKTLNHCNAFVTELGPAGNTLVYSTYLGGNDLDAANSIALDTNDEAIVTGYTQSTNFPTVNAAQAVYGGGGDAFVAKLSSNGTALVYSTYLGGSQTENISQYSTSPGATGGAVAVDVSGNAFVTGWTFSTNYPVLNAFQPTNATSFYPYSSAAFVTMLNPGGQLVYSTYFGGLYGDFGRAIGVDFNDNVYFAGNDVSGGLPTTNALQPDFAGGGTANLGDGFIAALDDTGANLIYSTYLGGSGDDQINGLAVRFDGAVAVTGVTGSPDFPLLDALQTNGNQGLFISANGGSGWTAGNSGLGSGIVYSIQFDPANPSIVYALTPNGCFKSTDGGADWVSASSGLNLGTLTAQPFASPATLLAADPVHSGTLYAGAYDGVYKTTNGGAAWTIASAGLPGSPIIQTLAVAPLTPATLYAGTSSKGIFKSLDGGNSWNVATNGLNCFDIVSLQVDPKNSANVYAGADNTFRGGGSLFKSTNGGASWTVAGSGLPAGPVKVVAFNPANSVIIYAIVGADPGESSSLCVSSNAGLNWSLLTSSDSYKFTALVVTAASAATGPTLTIGSAGNNDTLSWPDSFVGYALQSTPSLSSVNWQLVPQSPATNNGNLVATIPVSGAQGYYRLLLTNSAATPPPTFILGTDQASGQGVLQASVGETAWNAIGLSSDTINALAVNPANPSILYAGLAGKQDAFLATVTPTGQLYFSTYLAGSAADQGSAVAVDFTTVFMVGSTSSSDFPTTTTPSFALAHPLNILPSNAPPVRDNTSSIILAARAEFCPKGEVSFGRFTDIAKIGVSYAPFGDPKGPGLFNYVGVKFADGYFDSSGNNITIVSGNLPPGFDMTSGLITGTTPGPTGGYPITLQIVVGGCTYTGTLTIQVSN